MDEAKWKAAVQSCPPQRASTWVCLEPGEVAVMELAGNLTLLVSIQPR